MRRSTTSPAFLIFALHDLEDSAQKGGWEREREIRITKLGIGNAILGLLLLEMEKGAFFKRFDCVALAIARQYLDLVRSTQYEYKVLRSTKQIEILSILQARDFFAKIGLNRSHAIIQPRYS